MDCCICLLRFDVLWPACVPSVCILLLLMSKLTGRLRPCYGSCARHLLQSALLATPFVTPLPALQREFGFTLEQRSVLVDDVRVRASGRHAELAEAGEVQGDQGGVVGGGGCVEDGATNPHGGIWCQLGGTQLAVVLGA
jgi:hypothetical protein